MCGPPAPVPAFATAACLSSTRPSQLTLGAQNIGAPSARHSRSSSCPGKTEEAVAVHKVFTLVQTPPACVQRLYACPDPTCLWLKTLPTERLQKALTYCVWLWPTTRTKKRKMHNGCADAALRNETYTTTRSWAVHALKGVHFCHTRT